MKNTIAVIAALVPAIANASIIDPDWTESSDFKRELSVRANHAKELLGGRYRKSIVKVTEKVAEIDGMVLDLVEQRLPTKWKNKSEDIAQAIIDQAQKHSFDPVFLMAVIMNESSFNPDIRGSAGEIGLMQILPKTAAWFGKKAGLGRVTEKQLKNPIRNIEVGAAYMAYLRGEFDAHGQLYLAAYNMGKVNVKRALAREIKPKDYAGRVMNRYVKFYTEIRSIHQEELAANETSRVIASE